MDNVDRPSAVGPDRAADDLADRIWEQATQRLRAELAEATWLTWFQEARAVRFEHDILVLAVPNPLAADKIRRNYHAMVDAALQASTGRACTLEILVDTDAAEAAAAPRIEEAVQPAVAVAAEAPVTQRRRASRPGPRAPSTRATRSTSS